MSSLNRIICLVVLKCATNYAVFNSRKAFEQRWHEQELFKNHFLLLETTNIVANIKINDSYRVDLFHPTDLIILACFVVYDLRIINLCLNVI